MNSKSIALILAAFPAIVLAGSDTAPGEILVKFRSGGAPMSAKLAVGGQTINLIKEINVERIKVSGTSVAQAIKVFKADPNVVYAEPNYKKSLYYTPNDPRLSEQYGIIQTRTNLAWDIFKGNPNTVISVIDTGIKLDHEEFVGKIMPGSYDWSDGDGDVTDNTGSGHGTHCSGIAMAGTNNGKGVASSSFNAKMLFMKIFPNATDSVSASAIIDAANKGARVISMSYGSSFPSQTEQDACNYAWNKGVVLFAAAGNAGNTAKGYPAAHNNVIAVAATNDQDQRAGFSTYGDWVQIAAPGENILSSFFDSTSSYVYESGTSMACPFAASIAGLMIGRNPLVTNVKVRDTIFQTADNVGNFITKGRINAFKAVNLMVVPVPISGTPITASVGVIAGTAEGTQVGTYGSPGLAGQTIKSVEGNAFTIKSLNSVKVGGVATLDTFVQVATPLSDILSFNISVTARSASGSSCLIFAFNNVTGAWDQFGSMGMSASNKSGTFSIPIASLPKYINGANLVRLMARNVAPARTTATKDYLFVTDQLNIGGSAKPAP